MNTISLYGGMGFDGLARSIEVRTEGVEVLVRVDERPPALGGISAGTVLNLYLTHGEAEHLRDQLAVLLPAPLGADAAVEVTA